MNQRDATETAFLPIGALPTNIGGFLHALQPAVIINCQTGTSSIPYISWGNFELTFHVEYRTYGAN